MRKGHWEKNIFELIRRTAVDLPSDIEAGLRRAWQQEKKGSRAWKTLETILESVERSRKEDTPLCQDSGTLLFYFRVPVGFDTNRLVARTRVAVSRATRQGYLRQNAIDPISGAAYPTNIAPESPVFSFQQGARKTVEACLVMKGGGCENVGRQYSLPDDRLGAERDMAGVRRCALDAVWEAQGRGCAPGVLGVCIGGDRATGYLHSKEQFMRRLNDTPASRSLATLEERIHTDAQSLEIGPMGLGGRSSLLGVKVGAVSRVPGSYFVTVSYMCWAFRRRGVLLGPEGGVHRWLY